MSQWWAPTLNVVYADDQGHIGYQAIGHIPQRPGGLMGVPIADSTHEWQGVIPFATLPSSLDPPGWHPCHRQLAHHPGQLPHAALPRMGLALSQRAHLEVARRPRKNDAQ